ncbi:VG15 protein [Rhodococcus zopfii]
MLPEASAAYYHDQRRLTMEALAVAVDIWGTRPPRDFDAWFDANIDMLIELMIIGQRRAAETADEYVSDVLDELGTPVDPDVTPDPEGLIGVASDGRELDSLVYGAVIAAKGRIAAGVGVAQAWDSGLSALVRRVQTQLADAARVSTGLSIAARPGVGYVRMLNPPSCSRCALLAGRFYRWKTGFRRHPGCDCRHIPARESRADDLTTEPSAYFDSLSTEQQDKLFTKAGAEAIRNGADIGQVVNARRGMSTAQENAAGWIPKGRLSRTEVYGQQIATTTDGITRRGAAYRAMSQAGYARRQTDVRNGRRYFQARAPRLMPEGIYEIAEDRPDALRLLRLYGYIT